MSQSTSTAYSVPEALDTPAFREAWSEWCEHRREKQKPVTDRAARMQLKNLTPYGSAVAIATIERSIASGWIGLFPENISTVAAPRVRELELVERYTRDLFPTEAEAWAIVTQTIDALREAKSADEAGQIKEQLPPIVLAVANSIGFRNIAEGRSKDVRTEFCRLYRRQVEATVHRHLANRLPAHERMKVEG